MCSLTSAWYCSQNSFFFFFSFFFLLFLLYFSPSYFYFYTYIFWCVWKYFYEELFLLACLVCVQAEGGEEEEETAAATTTTSWIIQMLAGKRASKGGKKKASTENPEDSSLLNCDRDISSFMKCLTYFMPSAAAGKKLFVENPIFHEKEASSVDQLLGPVHQQSKLFCRSSSVAMLIFTLRFVCCPSCHAHARWTIPSFHNSYFLICIYFVSPRVCDIRHRQFFPFKRRTASTKWAYIFPHILQWNASSNFLGYRNIRHCQNVSSA